MRLNRLLRPAAALALALPALWAVHEAGANFAAADGFSGQGGVTCTSCHQPPHPTDDTAEAHLEGLPATWLPGAVYPLTIRVTGGPPALPAPAPQGGFDLAADAGTFAPDPARPELFRSPSPHEITYTAAGTQMRAWHVTWTAPGLTARPAPAHLWLAVLAANGNHVVAANASDGGETFDSTAATTATVPPDAAALAQWEALPLIPPTARATAAADGSWTVDGEHNDANATELLLRLDGGAWALRETGREWRVAVPAGAHVLDFRSDGSGRTSPVQTLAFGGTESSPSPASHTAPLPFAAALLAIALAFAEIRRRTA